MTKPLCEAASMAVEFLCNSEKIFLQNMVKMKVTVQVRAIATLSFFGHLVSTAPKEDHHRVIAAALRPPADWRRPVVARELPG